MTAATLPPRPSFGSNWQSHARGYARPGGAGAAALAVPRLADPASLQQLAGRTMGTTWSLRFDNPQMIALDLVRMRVEAALDTVISQMSHWEADSDISRFNRAEAGSRHVLRDEFAEVLACALHWAEASGGAFDPTVAPLVAEWGFGPEAADRVGAPVAAGQSARRVGWKLLAFDPPSRSVCQAGGVSLDLSGIAKGFAVDHGVAALNELGLTDLLFEVGGELRGSGRRPGGQPWRVQVDTQSHEPRHVALADMAIATSGDRWHVHERDGRRWSHTIDPRSGAPVSEALASVTVLHPRCMQADALATVLTVLGARDGLAFANTNDIAALFAVRHEGNIEVQGSATWEARA